jgi:hypothetical protein
MPNSTNFSYDSLTQFAVPNRALWSHNWKTSDVMHLETLRDLLRKQEKAKQSKDIVHQITKTRVDFTSTGVPLLSFAWNNGTWSEPVIFSKRGWKAFIAMITPFASRLRQWEYISQMDAVGAQIAKAAVNKLIQSVDFDALFRIQRTRVTLEDGTQHIVRMLRTVQSASTNGYTVVDNLDILEQALITDEFRDVPVISARLEDEAFSVRFLKTDVKPDEIVLNKQYPIIDLINSEVGLGRILFNSGMYRKWCDNGATSTSIDSSISFVHRGSHDRISDGLINGIHNIESASQRAVNQYNATLETEVNDLVALLDLELDAMAKQSARFKTTQEERDAIFNAMGDETSSDHGTLAAGVDAITFAAKALPINRKHDLEQMGFEFMERNLKRAINNKIVIEA